MRLRMLPLLALFVFVPALAADDKPKKPTLTLRLPAVDDLAADLRYLAEQLGRGEEAIQFEKLLKSMTGDKGLEGLDPKKPMGLYVYIGALGIDSEVVLMLPIADQQTFLDRLAALGIKPTEDKGLYEFQPKGSPFPAFFRFANGYVYGTLREKEALSDKKLLKPAAVIPPGEKDTFSLSLDLTGFPKELRGTLIGQVELRLADLKEKLPNETKAQTDFRGTALDEAVGLLKTLLTDSGMLTLRFNVDRQAGDVSVSVGLSGQEGSPLAKSLAELGKTKSAVAGLMTDDSAFGNRLTYQLTEGLRKKLAPVVDEALEKLLASTKNEGEKELIKPLLDALAPSLKEGKLDLALDIRGPSEKKLYTAVAGTGVKKGADIEKALKGFAEKLPAELKEKVSFDVAKAAGANIHRLNVEKDLDPESKKFGGENPVYFAIRDDAVFFSLGEDGLAALKDVLGVKAKVGSVMRMEVSMLRMAPLMAFQQKHAPKAVEEAFAKNKGGDKMFITLEGGKELRLRLGIKGAFLRLISLLDKAEKEEKKD